MCHNTYLIFARDNEARGNLWCLKTLVTLKLLLFIQCFPLGDFFYYFFIFIFYFLFFTKVVVMKVAPDVVTEYADLFNVDHSVKLTTVHWIDRLHVIGVRLNVSTSEIL